MIYSPKIKLRVLWIVKELGLANEEEISDRYEELFKEKLENCHLYVRRWKARKAFVIEEGRYKLAGIPVWFRSLNMSQLIQQNKTESKGMVKELEDLFAGGAPVGGGGQPKWRDFEPLTLTFEALDPILGGRINQDKTDDLKVFPKEDDRYTVPPSWFKGLFRDNQSLVNTVGIQYHVALGKGYWEEGTKLLPKAVETPIFKNGRGIGIGRYEAVPRGSKFTVNIRFPMKGSKITSKEKLKDFLDILADTPIKGLGSNPKYYGGRIKLLTMVSNKPPMAA